MGNCGHAPIRVMRPDDLDTVMKLWIEGNTDAHDFIPITHWNSNFEAVRGMIGNADIRVYDDEGVKGFIGLDGDYIAGLFVCRAYRSQGIGKALLDSVKDDHGALTLNVYVKNSKALAFYLREGFTRMKEDIDEVTGEHEIVMMFS